MAAPRIQILALAVLALAGTPLARSGAFLSVHSAPEKIGATAAFQPTIAVGNATSVKNATAVLNATAVGNAIAENIGDGEQVDVEGADALAEDFDADAAEEAEDPADAADADAAEVALYAGVDVADADDASPGDTNESSLLQADDVSGDDTDEAYLPESDFLKALKMSRGLFAGDLKAKSKPDSASPPNASLAKSSNTTSAADLSANASKAIAVASGQDSVDVANTGAVNERESVDLDTDAEEAEDPADVADADAAEAALYSADVADADDASPGDTDEASLLQEDDVSGDDTDEVVKMAEIASYEENELEADSASPPNSSLAQPSNMTSVANRSANVSKATVADDEQVDVEGVDVDALAEAFDTDAAEEAEDPADAADADAAEVALYAGVDVADADEESTEDNSAEEDVGDA